MLLPPGMAQWKRMIGFILLPEFLFFSSIFHQSLESPLYKGCFEVEEDFFSSTHLPPFICVFGLLPETLHYRGSIKTGTQRTLPIISPPAADISSGRCWLFPRPLRNLKVRVNSLFATGSLPVWYGFSPCLVRVLSLFSTGSLPIRFLLSSCKVQHVTSAPWLFNDNPWLMRHAPIAPFFLVFILLRGDRTFLTTSCLLLFGIIPKKLFKLLGGSDFSLYLCGVIAKNIRLWQQLHKVL